jgi:hypothetical protein
MAVESIQICILTCILPSWLGNAGAQTGVYGLTLWAPSLFVLLLKVTPQEAAKMMILLSVSGFIDRLSFSFFSELMGRRNAGGLLGFGAGLSTIIAGYNSTRHLPASRSSGCCWASPSSSPTAASLFSDLMRQRCGPHI